MVTQWTAACTAVVSRPEEGAPLRASSSEGGPRTRSLHHAWASVQNARPRAPLRPAALVSALSQGPRVTAKLWRSPSSS